MRVLLIDDMRNVAYLKQQYGVEVTHIARTFADGINMLKNEGPWDLLMLDHDLGCYDEDGRELTGYMVLLFLEEHLEYMPALIKVITDNSSARQKMLLAMTSIRKRQNEQGK